MSAGVYSLQTCLDIIQASADPSASLPRAGFLGELPRDMCFIVCFRKPSTAHALQDLLPRVCTQKRKSFKQGRKVVVRSSLCRLGLHSATCATWALARKHGAMLPRSFREPSAKSAGCFGHLGLLCSSSKRCVSCTQQYLSASTVTTLSCFSTHAN